MRRRSIVAFTRRLAVLLAAGLPLLRALETLGRQAHRPAERALIARLAGTIRAGGSLSEALRRHERVFGATYVNMVRAGEAGGVLHVVLSRLATHLEKARRINAKIQTAMIYPLVIMIVATAIVAALVLFVVPRFEDIFAGLLQGRPLPALTRALLEVSAAVRMHGPVGLLAFVAVAAAGTRLRRLPAVAVRVDRVLLGLPLLGELALKAALARMARLLGTLVASGVPILPALEIAGRTAGNAAVAVAVVRARQRVKDGSTLAAALGREDIFPPMLPGMVEVGEETGDLGGMLGRVADAFDEEVDHAVVALTSLAEPAMIVVMAIVVGTIVIALFLPLVDIVQQL